jgi:hypothetical protein
VTGGKRATAFPQRAPHRQDEPEGRRSGGLDRRVHAEGPPKDIVQKLNAEVNKQLRIPPSTSA